MCDATGCPIPHGQCHCGCGATTTLAPQTDTAKGYIRGEPVRYLRGHAARTAPVDYVIDKATGCWLWAQTINSHGYGRKHDGSGKQRQAHRVIYEQLVGPIPHGMDLDHLCRNRACVNPDHLEPVTPKENNRRGVSPTARNSTRGSCIRGHEFTPENTYTPPRGGRQCRACRRLRDGQSPG